jgi:hypothetical protein
MRPRGWLLIFTKVVGVRKEQLLGEDPAEAGSGGGVAHVCEPGTVSPVIISRNSDSRDPVMLNGAWEGKGEEHKDEREDDTAVHVGENSVL